MSGNIMRTVIAAAALAIAGSGNAAAGKEQQRFMIAQTTSGGKTYRRADPAADRCSPALAEAKARRMGVRDARAYNVTPNVVRVRGQQKGTQVRLVFANERNCPFIG